MESIRSLRRRHRNERAKGRPPLRRHGFIKTMPLEWRGERLHHHGDGGWQVICAFCVVCCVVTHQLDMSYLRFRGVTKWPNQACTIPFNNRITAKSVLAKKNSPHSPVCYVGIVRVSYVSHISHPLKITTMVKPLPHLPEVLAKVAVEGSNKI